MTLFDEYRWRGMLQDATEGAEAAFGGGGVQTGYVGFDPTASSLHVGHLLPIMGLVHLQRGGHRPIALVGGGTGLIGDPSGKSEERVLLTPDVVAGNAEAVRGQLEAFLEFGDGPNAARMVNNLEWLGEASLLEFLRDVGKHFPVNVILRKESVRRRLDDEAGLSYTEFSYLLLQSYDFYRLFVDHGCRFQFGGSDQWGNITGGIDLVRRMTGEKVHGAVFPLITTASGVKFGKTEAGAVWLDAERTSPYRFYQYWLNTADADLPAYLRFFSLRPRGEIGGLEESLRDRPQAREAHEALAAEVTQRVHGEDGLARARRATRILFGGEALEGLGADEIADIFADVPSSEVDREVLGGEGAGVVALLAELGVTPSRGEARRGIEQGGIYLNNRRVPEAGATVTLDDAVEGRFLVFRRGKKKYHLVRVTG